MSATAPTSCPVEAHLAHLVVRGLSPRTVLARRAQLHRFAGHLDVELGEDLLLVTEDDLEAWQQHMLGYSPNYRSSSAFHLREFYKFCHKRGYLTTNPAEVLVANRTPAQVPHPIPERDLDTAIAFAPPQVRAMLVLAAYCGLRAIEISRLTRDQVRDQAEEPLLVVIGKGDKQRVIPLPERVLDELRSFGLPGDDRGLVFPRADGRPGPQTPNRVSGLCNTYLHSLGIPESLHKLRHYYGTSMYSASKDIVMVQNIMGHSSPATTSGYVAYDRQAAHDVARTVAAAGSARPTPLRVVPDLRRRRPVVTRTPPAPVVVDQPPAQPAAPSPPPPSITTGSGDPPTAENLSARELEVLRLLAAGLSNRAVAKALGLADDTIKRHVQNIAGKLGSRGRVAIVATALRRGLVA